MELESKIEALLFWKGEPVSLHKLASLLGVDESKVNESISTLKEKLNGRGIVLVEKDEEVTLGTSPQLSDLIENLTKEELNKDLGKAGLETLSIVLYKGPIKRSEIDYIRGVNSNFILRSLLVRGLVEKIQAPQDQRSFLYKPTMELLSFLGITRIEDLPEYSETKEKLAEFINVEDQAKQNAT